MVICSKTFLHSSHLSLVISDLLIEFLALQTQEVLPGQNDATLGCDGAGGVDVVSSNHTYSDACTLTLRNGLRYLEECRKKRNVTKPKRLAQTLSPEGHRNLPASFFFSLIGLNMTLMSGGHLQTK